MPKQIIKSSITAREVAYQTVLASLRDEQFVAEGIRAWRNAQNPSQQERALAYEIASGAIRMARLLDHFAVQATAKKKLQLKLKEKALLRCAVYQITLMNGIPSHAAVNESVKIAKTHCHPTFVKFLNALLRTLSKTEPKLPNNTDIAALALRYSYPESFVTMLRERYDINTTVNILEAGNSSPSTMARIRSDDHDPDLGSAFAPVAAEPARIAKLIDTSRIDTVVSSTHYYLQNATPAHLTTKLLERLDTTPQKILDLCASPGGKTVLLHDTFPTASLHANDVSKKKMARLKENLEKFGIEATLTNTPGEQLDKQGPFDLIVIDAPCSNSGTYSRRAEARWRYTEDNIKEITILQQKLISNAASLLSPNGALLYLTCSICPLENEECVRFAEKKGLKSIGQPITQLPTKEGWDGGFGCLMKLESNLS